MIIDELPKNEDAERGLIGLCLVEGFIPEQARDLATTDFYTPLAKAAWSAMLELEADGLELEPIAVADVIKRMGATYGVAELMNLTYGMTHVNAARFVNPIRDCSIRRQTINKLHGAIVGIQSGTKRAEEIRETIGEIEAVARPSGSFRELSDILETDVKRKLADLSHGITRRIPTGFPAIDRAIGGGLSKSDVVVVAAVTSGGKSAFVLQMSANIAKAGYPVAFVSGEMSDEENGARILSQSAKFYNLNAALSIGQDDREYLERWADALKSIPLYLDSTSTDLQSVARGLRHLVEEKGIQVLVIDYLQLFKTGRLDARTRTERIAEVSQELKRIAQEFKIAIIEVVQFNREGAKSVKPSLYDLADSSQIEKDASLVFILDRDRETDEITLRIEKGRNVGLSTITGRFDGKTLTFEL